MQSMRLSESAIARTVRNRRGRLFPLSSVSQKRHCQFKAELRRFMTQGIVVMDRNFCPECGSPIFSDAAVMPGVAFIKAGTLDDTSWVDPKMHVYCDSKERWTPIPDDSQKFGKMPA